jgi:hypothetical protein
MVTQKLFTSASYPCIKDELYDQETNELTIVLFTDSETEVPPGVWMNDEGVYEVVVRGNHISKDALLQSLEELSEITGITYEVEFAE